MSKEEIYENIEKGDLFDFIGDRQDAIEKEYALKAMDQFAKQEAIEYAKFRDNYRHIESINWKHNVTDKIGMVTWIGASDDKIWEAYQKGEQLVHWMEKELQQSENKSKNKQ